MTSQPFSIVLSHKPAAACWGQGALLSYDAQQITVHLSQQLSLMQIQKAARKLDAQGIHHIKLTGAEWGLEQCWAFWQGYRAAKGERQVEWPELQDSEQEELYRRLQIIDWVRETINLPAEVLSPEQLARSAVDLINDIAPASFRFSIIKGDKLSELGYMGLHTVGRGSARPPVLLILDYNPSGQDQTPVYACLVGKGITFDTGGYSLKPSGPMDSMKSDMGGAATLTGALALAAARGLDRRVKLLLCCADNMVSGDAFRLGDIIHYRNGKTVEVMNTDAEGRLVLADGLIDASACQPQLLIDAATLTGAAKVALGNDYHAMFSFDDKAAQALLSCADQAGEAFWRLPLAEFHRQHLPSNFADLSNVAGAAHTAGASTAAAFLSHFVERYREGWLHIDCSATYRKNAVEQWAAGATGLGVLTLALLLQR